MSKREVNCRRRARPARGTAWVAAAIAGAAVTCTLPAVASAASFLWDGGGNNSDWSTNNNWNPNSAPPAANTSDTITFAGTTRLTPNLNANRTIASLTFANTAGLFTLGNSGGSVLTIGSGGINQQDADTQTISHGLTLGAGQTWNAAAGALVASGQLNLNGSTLTLDGDFATTLSGIVSGAGAVTKNGAGTLTLSGASANTFTGTTTVNAGTLSLNKTAANGAIGGSLIIGNDSSGVITAIVVQLANQQIADGATVTVRRSGLYDLATGNRSETIAGLVLEDGAVQTGLGTLTLIGPLASSNVTPGAVSTLSGNLNLNGGTRTITSSAGNTLNLSAVIANGGISLQGNGVVNFTGVNTFAGGFEHAAGSTVDIGNDTALGTGTITTAAGATRTFTTSGGARTLANNVVLSGAAQFNLSSLNDLTLSGTISGAAGITKTGAPTMLLSGVGNSFGGVTTVTAGRLVLGADNALGATAAGTVVASGATLGWTTSYLAAEPITISGTGVDGIGALWTNAGTNTFAGVVTLAADAMITSSSGGGTRFTGPINAAGFNLTLRVNASPSSFSGVISGGAGATAGLTKSGIGIALLSGADNTYAGPTVINAGPLAIGTGNNIPDTSAVTLADVAGAMLRLDGGDVETIASLAGGGASGGSVQLSAGAHLTTGGNNTSTTFAGNITDDGVVGGHLTKTGTGTMTLGGAASTYRGTTTVTAGTLRVSGGASIGDLSAVVLNAGTTLDVAATETIGGLAGSGAVVLQPGAGLTAGGNGASTTFAGTISEQTAATGGAFSKLGAGTLTLSGVNTYAGETRVDGGVLRITGGAGISDASTVRVGGGSGMSLDVAADETIGGLTGGGASNVGLTLSGGTLTVIGGGTFGGIISGAGNLTKNGGADLFLRGSNTFSGKLTINAGTIDIHEDIHLGGPPAAFVADQLTIDNGGTLRMNSGIRTLSANRGITIGPNHGRILAGTAAVLTFPMKLSGGGDLTFGTHGTITTTPTVTLSGVNTTFTGRTIVDGVILTIAQDSNLSAAPGVFSANKLTLVGGGTLKITATMTLPATRGITLLNGGTGGGAFDINSSQTLTTAAPITGAGALTKRGIGTLHLGGIAHSYTGKTTLDAGTVIAQQDTSFGPAPAGPVADQLTINSATLRWTTNGSGIAATRGVRLGTSSSTISVDAGITLPVNSPISGVGGLTKTGPGTLNLLGSNSYSGATSVGAGRMVLNQTFVTNTSFAVSAGAVVELAETPAVTLKTASVIAAGRLDVKNDKLILTSQPIGTWNGSAYTGVTGMITSAYNFGSWNSNGITTSMPAALQSLTTLGVATAEQIGVDMFGGVSVAPSNVLVMYTYAGDGNLDGQIDAGDYGILDFFIQTPGASGYANGDYNYDGFIDPADYGTIDNNIQFQGPPFPTGSSAAASAGGASALSAVTAVPEPSAAACGLTLLAASLLPRRRRSRRSQSR